jgi:hypothetical protein
MKNSCPRLSWAGIDLAITVFYFSTPNTLLALEQAGF